MRPETFRSNYKNFSKQTISWLDSDSEELYKQNIIKKYEELDRNGWVNKTIKYSFNNFGFRSKDFNSDPSVAFFGCSHTLGIGLPEEETFAKIISNKLNLECYNFGQSGGSMDTVFRLGYFWINKIKPKIVFVLSPDSSRIELIDQQGYFVTLKKQKEHLGSFYSLQNTKNTSYYEEYLSRVENSKLNSLKNFLAIELLCNKQKIKLVYFTFEDDIIRNENLINLDDKARDLLHCGTQTNRLFAEYALSKM